MSSARRRQFVALVAATAAVVFVLVSPFGGSPAQAEWNECNTHVTALDPVPGFASAVRASTDVGTNGQVGACVMTLGGCPPTIVGPCFITGGAVVVHTYDVFSSPGFFANPQVCVEAHPVADVCQYGGLFGAEVGTTFISVCAASQCVPVRP